MTDRRGAAAPALERSERPARNLDLGLAPRERYAQLRPDALGASARLLHALAAAVPPTLRRYADRVREVTEDRFHDDAEARAAIHDAPERPTSWREVVLANVSYDLAVSVLGCSTLAAATADGPVLARNMDWWPADLLAQTTYAFHGRRGGEAQWIHAGWPGAIGVVTGLSARGFALSLNAVGSGEGLREDGWPVLAFARRVLEDAFSFEHALELLRETTLAAAALFVLVGSDNEQRVVVERSPTRAALRWPDDPAAPLLATNDYRALRESPAVRGSGGFLQATACRRYAELFALAHGLPADRPHDDETFLRALGRPGVLTDITAQQIVMRPRQGKARVTVPRRLLGSRAAVA